MVLFQKCCVADVLHFLMMPVNAPAKREMHQADVIDGIPIPAHANLVNVVDTSLFAAYTALLGYAAFVDIGFDIVCKGDERFLGGDSLVYDHVDQKSDVQPSSIHAAIVQRKGADGFCGQACSQSIKYHCPS